VAAAACAVAMGVAGCASSLSPEEYQGLVTGFERSVQPSIDRLTAATSVAEVDSARHEIAAAMQTQEEALRDVSPPDEARAQHEAVLAFLRSAPGLLALAPPDASPDECGIAPTAEEQTTLAKADVQQQLATAASGVSSADFAAAG